MVGEGEETTVLLQATGARRAGHDQLADKFEERMKGYTTRKDDHIGE